MVLNISLQVCCFGAHITVKMPCSDLGLLRLISRKIRVTQIQMHIHIQYTAL